MTAPRDTELEKAAERWATGDQHEQRICPTDWVVHWAQTAYIRGALDERARQSARVERLERLERVLHLAQALREANRMLQIEECYEYYSDLFEALAALDSPGDGEKEK